MTDYVLDDRYTLIERIATGGMGEVWRGTDQLLGRPVAIKMLAAMHAGDEQFRARFRAEARYASSLSHSGITRVFDYGEQSPLGGPYLVMELVDGQPLSEILERYGRLDPYVVLDIVAQSARALDAAHRAGIVHRDIKPGNLLIMADGTTKITDFGIAKANAPDINLTATGIVMGTALYVSPEQATGAPLTGASDVYSLGVVAYECLAGDPPFIADQPLAIAIMHKHDPVPPLPADVPRPVADLVYAMLAKNPEDRPESARHVADRAEVIREARNRNGYAGPNTADLPVVPNFPPPTSNDLYQIDAERMAEPRRAQSRNLLIAGIGAAAVGVIAIIAVLISSNGPTTANRSSSTTLPTQTASQSARSASSSASPTSGTGEAGLLPAGNNIGATGVGVSASKSTGATATKKPPATKTSPATGSSGTKTSPAVGGSGTATGPGGGGTATGPGGGGTSTGSPPPNSSPPTSPTDSATPIVSSSASAGT
ncbi:MAG TPA: serine/threonine-protein kinase [Trebonia sp.]|nr:serine/threonine-protein kinase [Trebonia sp.]